MTAIALLMMLMSQPPATLDQVKAEGNPERRAHAAIEFAVQAERQAESAYDKGDTDGVQSSLKTMKEAMEVARESFEAWGKSANRHPGPYKFAETRSREILGRLNDLERRMDEGERPLLDVPKSTVLQIHDEWFDAIMGKRK